VKRAPVIEEPEADGPVDAGLQSLLVPVGIDGDLTGFLRRVLHPRDGAVRGRGG